FIEKKGDYLLFLGRANNGKGIHIAADIATKLNKSLVIAGQGPLAPEISKLPNVNYVGIASPKRRAQLLANAQATICASTYLEPFCGVQIESFLSGTPVISTDWGAFAEYNLHGLTGFRCKTMEQFIWAVEHSGTIQPKQCRLWGENFLLPKIAPRYTDYF